jgi:hypothetical protein
MKGAEEDRGTVIRVECYSGHKSNERPVSFWVEDEKKVVENIIDRWTGEDHDYFKLATDDHKVYLIRYDRRGDFWTLEKVMERIGKH